ncbi:MAG: hypothetical protein JWM10_752 [Myxococcaceae bacterium]|nr:hypothetical protein [Myxococcaceae bacterium]
MIVLQSLRGVEAVLLPNKPHTLGQCTRRAQGCKGEVLFRPAGLRPVERVGSRVHEQVMVSRNLFWLLPVVCGLLGFRRGYALAPWVRARFLPRADPDPPEARPVGDAAETIAAGLVLAALAVVLLGSLVGCRPERHDG